MMKAPEVIVLALIIPRYLRQIIFFIPPVTLILLILVAYIFLIMYSLDLF